jgi:hypothetical protein
VVASVVGLCGGLTNRVSKTTKEAPGTLANHWTSTKGAKGTTVVVLMVVGPLVAWVSPEVVFS